MVATQRMRSQIQAIEVGFLWKVAQRVTSSGVEPPLLHIESIWLGCLPLEDGRSPSLFVLVMSFILFGYLRFYFSVPFFGPL